MISLVTAFFICISIFSSIDANAASVGAVFKNNKGVKQLSEEKKMEAYDTLSGASVKYPDEPALSYNLGQIFEANEEKEKAAQAYASASKNASDPELKFNALFNAARVLGDLKKRDEALKLYQDALEIKPDSLETKTNIELLMANAGGGGGEGENDQDKKDQQGKDKEKQPDPKDNQDRENESKSKPKPKPFESKELNQQDVKKILDELKRQEEGVRAKFNEKYRKENPVDKDW